MAHGFRRMNSYFAKFPVQLVWLQLDGLGKQRVSTAPPPSANSTASMIIGSTTWARSNWHSTSCKQIGSQHLCTSISTWEVTHPCLTDMRDNTPLQSCMGWTTQTTWLLHVQVEAVLISASLSAMCSRKHSSTKIVAACSDIFWLASHGFLMSTGWSYQFIRLSNSMNPWRPPSFNPPSSIRDKILMQDLWASLHDGRGEVTNGSNPYSTARHMMASPFWKCMEIGNVCKTCP